MDVDHDVIGVKVNRDGKPFLKHEKFTTRKRIHVEAFTPLRGGAGCGKTISV
jgi:hypothetical protein